MDPWIALRWIAPALDIRPLSGTPHWNIESKVPPESSVHTLQNGAQ